MPDILIHLQNIASGATVRPFSEASSNWAFRRCPYPQGARYAVGMVHDGAAGGLEAEISMGTTKVLQRSDVSAGGTDGVMPTPDGTQARPFTVFDAEFNDEIDLVLFETGAVATTDCMINASVVPH
jgi:hypothetical protein